MTTSPDIAVAGGRAGHARALLSLGLPLIGSHLAQFAITMTDTVMLGWYGVTELAALVVAGSVWFVMFVVGSGFAWAVMPMIAAAAGTENDRQVRRVTRMGAWLSLFFALAMVPILIFAEPLFLALGQAPEVADRAAIYLSIAGLGLIPGLFMMTMKSYFSALERTRVVLAVTVGMALLNVPINYALIFGNWGAPELGVAGAAIASNTIQVAAALVLILVAMRITPEYDLFRNPFRPDWEAFGRVFRLGWPIGLTNLAEVGLFSASSIMVGWIGVKELAAHGIALQIASATFMIHIGLSQAVTVRTGRAFGRRDEGGLREGAGVGLVLSACVVVLTIALFLLVPKPLIGAFLAPDEPARLDILEIGAVLLAMAALFQAVDALQVMSLGMLRGVQDTRVPMVMAGLSYWVVGIPVSYLFGFTLGMGAVGIWLGLSVGLALAGGLLSYRFWAAASRLRVP